MTPRAPGPIASNTPQARTRDVNFNAIGGLHYRHARGVCHIEFGCVLGGAWVVRLFAFGDR